MVTWGQLVIINLYGCNPARISDQKFIADFLPRLCQHIHMVPHASALVDRFWDGELEGVSGVQLLKTSSITIHADEMENRVFLDVFSCSRFESRKATQFATQEFEAMRSCYRTIVRK